MSIPFALSTSLPSAKFAPRAGTIAIRSNGPNPLTIATPSIITTTSRGVVPSLSMDHHRRTQAIRWLNIPFESFVEQLPPIPTRYEGLRPLHEFLGYRPTQQLITMTVRNPADGALMPPNSKAGVSVSCVQGIRKISITDWSSYTASCKPDFAIAMSDTPWTQTPHSQKRITKSIERSAIWLGELLRSKISNHSEDTPLHVLVQMAGGTSLAARDAFADSLTEVLFGPEADVVKPLNCLDDGVSGYVFDLVPLRVSLGETAPTSALVPLLTASLTPLPLEKPRFVHTAQSAHEMLYLIEHVGIDLFDAHWAQQAANIGVALDFTFPVRKPTGQRREIGHNLYDTCYARQFSPLADSFVGYANAVDGSVVCPCLACSPITPAERISHSSIDEPAPAAEYRPSFTRAYVHHLLHTHEMSAHSLLAAHNLTVLDAMMTGARSVILDQGVQGFHEQVEIFYAEYEEHSTVFEAAKETWKEVDMARGKGRLAREKMVEE